MTDDVKVQPHPFAITTRLSKEFGYPKAFASSKLAWDFVDSTTPSAGGGRVADSNTLTLVSDLGVLTRNGEPLKARQTQLRTLFGNHYDGPRIHFLLSFFLEELAKPGLSKTAAIDLLVDNGVPFIPWPLLQEHLRQGAAKVKANRPLSALNWATDYDAFCVAYKPPKPSPTPGEQEAASQKLAKVFEFWDSALTTHNKKQRPEKQVHFSDSDLQSFAASEFSISDGGTAHVSKSSTLNSDLRAKLAFIKPPLHARAEKLKLAEDLKRQAREIEDAIDEDSTSSSTKKHKRRNHDSGSDDDADQGVSALESLMKSVRRKIEISDYIDFASISTSRLYEIKMLNATSSKTTRLNANISFRTTLSEADVKVLSEDLGSIFDGFLFHYLEMVNESQLPTPVKTIFDRIKWWQWVASNFVGNPAAQAMFIKHFMVYHHSEEFWEPVVKNCHTLVAKCKETCSLHTQAAQRPPPPPKGSRPIASNGSGKGGKGGKNTPTQVAKLATLKTRFPGSCLSRIIKQKNCFSEDKGITCKYTHTCVWCHSATCRATCNMAESF